MSIPSTNRHPTYNHHMVTRVEGEDEHHPPLVCPRGQKSKAKGYGLPPLVTHLDKRPRGGYWRQLDVASL